MEKIITEMVFAEKLYINEICLTTETTGDLNRSLPSLYYMKFTFDLNINYYI